LQPPSAIPETPKLGTEVNEIGEMAHTFTHWFYPMLNHCQLGTEHFWLDCSMCLELSCERVRTKHEIQNSAADVVQMIYDTKARHSLFFNPNFSHEGVQGRIDKYGLVTVQVCGMLHQ
jgi:hypothetical protein